MPDLTPIFGHGPAYTKKFHDIYVDLASRYRIPLVPFLLEGVKAWLIDQ